jgi:hypothetical protein
MSREPDAEAFAQQLAAALDQEAERTARRDDVAVDPVTDAVVAQLRAPATWSDPPADLRTRVLAAVATEQADQVEPADGATVRPLVPRRRRLLWAIPAAAVAAVVFTFSVLAVNDYVNRPDRSTTYSAAGTALAPQAGAQVSIAPAAAGFSVIIDAHDLPAAAPGSYYAAFLTGPRGVVPLGSFHARKLGKPITMWSGVDPKDYPTFTVTLQREGGPPGPSDLVVLRGTLSG